MTTLKNRDKVTWQPISFLPQISHMIDGMLDAAKETYGPLRQVRVHDDFTIRRILEVICPQVDDEWLYEEQLDLWLQLPHLEIGQREEIQRLQIQLLELKQVNRKILAIAKEHKGKTIKKVMAMSDEEVAMSFLSGKL